MQYDEYLKRRNWKAGSILQNWFNKRLLLKVSSDLNRDIASCSILEVGSGTGELASVAAQLGVTTYSAIEPNPHLAEITRSKFPGAVVFENYLPEIPIQLQKSFDLVIAVHVIEHARNGYEARDWINSLWETVAENGVLVIVSPNSLDFKMYFWDIDWSHAFPTTVNNLSQIYKDLSIPIIRAKVMRLGRTNGFSNFLGFLISNLIFTRFANLISRSIINRELGTGIQAGALWGVTYVVGQKNYGD
jgi:2-polyprenyl-3-methyl-5-hydroxy-6-metoxy-1,4-benzoquinol methylase